VELLGTASTGRAFITSAAVSSDGTLAAFGTIAGTIAIIAIERFADGPVAVMRQGRGLTAAGGVPSMTFHRSSPVLIAVGGMRNAIVWDLTDPGTPVRASDLSRFGQGIWAPWGSALSPDGGLFAVGGAGNAITLISMSDYRAPRLPPGATPNPRPSLKAPRARHLAFHPSAPVLAAGSGDGTLTLWSTDRPHAPRDLPALPAHGDVVSSVGFTADGAVLVTSGADEKTVVWDAAEPAKPRVITSIPATNDPIAAVSPVEPVVVIADGTGGHGTITLWDLSAPARPTPISVADTNRASALAWSPDGQLIAAGYLGGTACLWRRP
jgi:WD40 repeat protein